MPRHAITLAVSCITILLAAPSRAQSPFWGDRRPGPHAVGFRVIDTVDVTRSFPAPDGTMAPRPMRLYVWYPAAEDPTSRYVTWGEIIRESLALSPRRADSVEVFGRLLRRELAASDTLVTSARLDSLSRLPMAARWRPRALAGPFPLVLITPDLPGNFMVIAEQLASHGFVIVGTASRSHTTLQSMESTPTSGSIDVEVDDLEFALGAARGWRSVDARRVGVMGFSTGSLSALAFAFRSRVPSAVVALEGWEGWDPGVEIMQSYRHFDPAAFRAAYLLIGKAADVPSPAFRKTSAFFDSIRSARRWRVAFDSATHGDFLGLSRNRRPIFVRSNAYLLAFLRTQLAATRAGQWLPDSAASGVGSGVHVETFATVAARPGREEFFRLAETDPARALSRFRAERLGDSTYTPFTESSLGRLANLSRDLRPADAVILAEIVALGYPESARAAARQSDAYWAAGRKDDARTAAQRALDLIERDGALSADQKDAVRTRLQARLQP